MHANKQVKNQAQNNPPHIFDRVFKRLMTLSKPVIIQFINGLFQTNYPLDSPVIQLATESVTDKLERFIADIQFLISTDKYFIEIQMSEDEEMAIRVFNYEYLDAIKNKIIEKNVIKLNFSRCTVIYLEPKKTTPEELIVELRFPDESVHRFKIPTFKFLDHSISELERLNMTFLLPFYLLKLRQKVKRAQTKKERLGLSYEMKALMEKIIETIKRNEEKGQMSRTDARIVIELMGKLYDNMYKQYPEFKESNTMLDDMLLTYSEEAEIRTAKKMAQKIAQNLIKKGLSVEEIAETTELDIETVESLYKQGQNKLSTNCD